jgi:predicted nucleic acid-binding protein
VTRVVDASVIVKMFADEAGSDRAIHLLDTGDRLLAPAHAFAEVGEVISRKMRAGLVGQQQFALLVDAIARDFEVVPIPLLMDSVELALSTGASVYDCLYVALAAQEGCPLVTADARLVAKFAATRHAGLLETL